MCVCVCIYLVTLKESHPAFGSACGHDDAARPQLLPPFLGLQPQAPGAPLALQGRHGAAAPNLADQGG